MPNPYLQAACLGIVAGMRSMSAPAIVSDHFACAPSEALTQSPLGFLASPTTATVFKWLAFGEIAADKLPIIPARIDPGPLTGRGISGGLVGAAVCIADGESPVAGAVIGAAAAIASSFAFYYLRRALGQKGKIPDPLLAAAEDALALNLGRTALT